MLRVIFILIIAFSHNAVCQPYSRTEVADTLAVMNDQAKVEYINQNFYSIYSADFSFAKELTASAIKISEQNRWKTHQAHALMNYGIVTYLKGEYDKSLPAYLASYELFDSLKDFTGMAMVCIEMANYYQKNGHIEKKYAFLDSAEQWSTKASNEFTLAKSYGMRATFLYNDGKIKEAKKYYLKNYEAYKSMNHQVGLGYVLLDLAKYAQLEGNFLQAILYIDESTAIRTQLNDLQGIAENRLLLGDLHLRKKNHAKAIIYFKECIDYGTEIEYPDLVRKAYARIALVHQSKGNYKRALIYKDSAYMLKDSLFNLERTRTIENLQTKYETVKKEQQINIQQARLAEQKALLNQNRILIIGLILLALLIVIIGVLLRNRLKKQQLLVLRKKELNYKESQLNAIISSQEKERKRFATDLHDGFGQLITVLKLNVNTIRTKEISFEKKNELFNQSEEILNGMYDELRGICFNLMPHTLVQKGLIPALDEFVNRISLSGKVSVELLVFDFDQRLEDLIEISIYRVVQEWINNVLKYNSANHITIQLTQDYEELTLTIEDNGQGFDTERLINGKGNGWKNMNSRSNLIKGTLEIDSSPNQAGTLLVLNIPLKEGSHLNAGTDINIQEEQDSIE